MINYTELIERLRASNREALVSSEEAASAIETLLAERDAAMEDIFTAGKKEPLALCAINARRADVGNAPDGTGAVPGKNKTERRESLKQAE